MCVSKAILWILYEITAEKQLRLFSFVFWNFGGQGGQPCDSRDFGYVCQICLSVCLSICLSDCLSIYLPHCVYESALVRASVYKECAHDNVTRASRNSLNNLLPWTAIFGQQPRMGSMTYAFTYMGNFLLPLFLCPPPLKSLSRGRNFGLKAHIPA